MGNSIARFFTSYDQKGLATMKPFSRLLSWFSKTAYEINPPKEHAGYVLINNHNTIKAWKNEVDKKIIFALRGTEVKDTKRDDIGSDLDFAMGSEDQNARFKIAYTIVELIMKRNPGYQFIVTGHSLGGGIAYRLGDRFKNITGEVFNPAINVRTLRDSDGTTRRIKANIIHGDPVAGYLGRPLPNAQIYSPAYGKERDELLKKPLQERLLYLHKMDRFPRI